ncbi:hypothetical protein IMZ48_23930 [Candidatus Bathyarchaeota archaeon]|nr:hypothetical protein [Candidatus Bathyarchaeota archaeon]
MTALLTKCLGPWLDLDAEQVGLIAVAIIGTGLAVIGGIAYEDGAVKKIVLLIFFVSVLLASGCAAGTAFRQDALLELGNVLTQLDTGAAEAEVGLLLRLQQEEDQKKAALAEALVLAGGNAATIDDRLTQFWGQWGVVQQDRANGMERFRRMSAQSAHGRLILARLLTLERQRQTVDQQLQEYRVLAENYARQSLGLTIGGGQ